MLRGELQAEGESFREKELLIFEREGEILNIDVKENTKLLVMNGEPIDEPIAAYGPFVMNTKAEILEAIQDYNNGTFAKY